MGISFQTLRDTLGLTPDLETQAQLDAVKQWCFEHISRDVVYEGDARTQYQQYLAYAQHYLDHFLPQIPDAMERCVSHYNNMTTVQYVAYMGYDRFMSTLSTTAGDLYNQSTPSGTTPLHLSASKGHRYTLEGLLERGADPTRANTDGKLPVHCALFVPSVSNNHLVENKEIIFNDLIARAPQTLKNRDNSGDSVAHLMAKSGFYRLLSGLVVAHNPILLYKNNQARCPIHTAILNGERDIARLLLSMEGGALLTDAEGRLPLHYAAQCGSGAMLELCCEWTPDINARDKNKKTALIFAAESMNIPAIKTLMEQNPSVVWVDYAGKPALDYLLMCVKRTKNQTLITWISDHARIPGDTSTAGTFHKK